MGAVFARGGWRWSGRHSRLLARLQDADGEERGTMFEYALALAFLLPLLFGVFSTARSQRITVESKSLAEDLVRMCRQGVDFSAPANRGIVLQLARGRGLSLGGGGGTVILSRVHLVDGADCRHCTNDGLAVFDRQIVIGDSAVAHGQTGTPPVDPATGLVRDPANDPAARARITEEEVKSGTPVWICELWFPSPDQPGGIYARVAD